MMYANSTSFENAEDVSRIAPEIEVETISDYIWNPDPVEFVTNYFLNHFLPLMVFIFIVYIISNFITFVARGESFEKKLGEAKRVLLITAHPDDECMFFGPTLTYLTATSDVYLVCLSNGDFEGIGAKRCKELWLSCEKLGINCGNIRLCKHQLLPDNPKSSWSPLLIGHIISQFVETFRIDTLITFDAYGVSGHLNHSAIYRAIMHLSGKRGIPSYCKMYVLESVSIFRKYSLCADLLFSYFMNKYVYVSSPARRQMILDAMTQHSSQLLWYRRLYLIFSRYTYINTLKLVS